MTAAPVAPITYDIPAAAERLGCREHWLRRQIRARRVPHSRMGREVRLTDEHLLQIAEQMTVHPVGTPQPDIPRIPSRRRKTA